jgi:hypothetical protein
MPLSGATEWADTIIVQAGTDNANSCRLDSLQGQPRPDMSQSPNVDITGSRNFGKIWIKGER